MQHCLKQFLIQKGQFSVNHHMLWLGSVAVACWTSDREVAGLTPSQGTAR